MRQKPRTTHSTGRSNAQRQEDMARRKEKFLAALEMCGTIRGSCGVAGIARTTYHGWIADDQEFAKEFDRARIMFAESLEELALARVRNPDKNRGSDLLLVTLLNANMPSKYRPQVAMSEDSAKDLLIEWRKVAREHREDPSGNVPGKSGVDLAPNMEEQLREALAGKKDTLKETEEPVSGEE